MCIKQRSMLSVWPWVLQCVSEKAGHMSTTRWHKVRLVRTQDLVAALQLEGLPVVAQLVDVVAQLLHVLQALRHHHLLLHQV